MNELDDDDDDDDDDVFSSFDKAVKLSSTSNRERIGVCIYRFFGPPCTQRRVVQTTGGLSLTDRQLVKTVRWRHVSRVHTCHTVANQAIISTPHRTELAFQLAQTVFN